MEIKGSHYNQPHAKPYALRTDYLSSCRSPQIETWKVTQQNLIRRLKTWIECQRKGIASDIKFSQEEWDVLSLAGQPWTNLPAWLTVIPGATEKTKPIVILSDLEIPTDQQIRLAYPWSPLETMIIAPLTSTLERVSPQNMGRVWIGAAVDQALFVPIWDQEDEDEHPV